MLGLGGVALLAGLGLLIQLRRAGGHMPPG
jgi:hypothetical protein